jgi:diguanylate cyclase (GGDEF)-like protein
MSTARTIAIPERRIYLGEAIAEQIRASELPFEPRQFEFWFAYKSRRNAALNAAADTITAQNGALTGPDIERLHEAYLSPWRMGDDADAIATRLSERLEKLNLTLESAIGSAQEQRETLAAEAAELSNGGSLKDILAAIGRLAQRIQEGQTRLALLEARMDAMHREIGAIRQQLSTVRSECQTDPTTGLPNRASFHAAIARAIGEATASRQSLSVVLCDLDYFTAFNENFGNFVGDQVLRAIAMLFKSHMRPGDTVARFESDTFAAILPLMRGSDAVACADRFRQTLMAHELVPHPNGAGRVTVSIGVADAIKGDTLEFLLRRAGNGLQIAKREGRNRVVEMTPDGPLWKAERRA